MRKRIGCDIMKNTYKAPKLELMNLSKDVITTSAADPYKADIKWDLNASIADPADYIDNVNG